MYTELVPLPVLLYDVIYIAYMISISLSVKSVSIRNAFKALNHLKYLKYHRHYNVRNFL